MRWSRLAALVISCVFACAPWSALSQAHWGLQDWSTENGLPQNSVHQILQTTDGFLWIATEGGAARFDGADFRVFDQQNTPAFTTDDTCCLAQTHDGSLWVGTADGLLRQHAGVWERVTGLGGPAPVGVLALDAMDDSSLLVLTTGGLFRVDAAGRVQAAGGETGENAVAVASVPGGVVLAVEAAGVFASSDHGLHFRQLAVSTDASPAGLTAGADGSVWVWSAQRVTRLHGGVRTSWAAGAQMPGSRINSVMLDRSGRAWVGTNRGLAFIDVQSGAVHPMLQTGETPVLSTLEDREGNLWVGTENSGLEILRPESFRQLPALENRVITSVVQSTGGTAWVGTRDDGVWSVSAGADARPAAARPLASQIILSLAPGLHNDLWVGTPDGLNHLEDGKVRTFTSVDGLPDDFIRSLYMEPGGVLWAGTRRGLARWQPGSVRVWTRADGLASDLVGAMLRTTDGGLWVATLGGLSNLRNGRVTTYTRALGVPGDIITSLAESADGTVWAGTRDGGLAYGRGGRFVACHGAALPRSIDSLIADSEGFIWMGTRDGLVRAPVDALERCGAGRPCGVPVHRFGMLDGMPSEEASTIGHPAAWRMRDGELWFATRKGVAIVDPSELRLNDSAPPVVVESFMVDGLRQPQQGLLRIGPGHASFTFHYAGLSYTAPARVRYRYRLEGFDRQWTLAGDRRTAYYTNLPGRAYTFRVEAANGDGPWGAAGAELHFVVLPPFYRRWWFYLLVLLGVGACAYLWHALRVTRLRAQFRAVLGERTRIAREIHDTLAQDLVGVSLQLETAAQLLAGSQTAAAGEQLDATRALVRQGLKDARASIWELRATAAEGTLPARLSRLTERGKEGLSLRVKTTGAYRALDARVESELLRIAQEAVTNLVRHAGASAAVVLLEYGAEQVTLRIEDDGRGFSAGSVGDGHYGVQGMRERARTIGAAFTLDTRPEEGTRIRVTVPTE